MSGEKFAEIISEYYPGIDTNLCQHLSMFFNSEERQRFLEFSGIGEE